MSSQAPAAPAATEQAAHQAATEQAAHQAATAQAAGHQAGADIPAGAPDGFERLWVPHRMAYVDGQSRPGQGDDCPFCSAPSKSDEEGLIVARGKQVYALMNLFPYNPGHVLVCPYRHVADLTELSVEEANELTAFTKTAMQAIRQARMPHGFNLGINQGSVAGAGIAAHLHQHVVPRWTGDSNFFPIIAQTRALPELLGTTRASIAAAWALC